MTTPNTPQGANHLPQEIREAIEQALAVLREVVQEGDATKEALKSCEDAHVTLQRFLNETPYLTKPDDGVGGAQSKWDVARAERDALRTQLAQSQSECEEQARLNGAGASRELALMGKLQRAQAENARLKEQHDLIQAQIVLPASVPKSWMELATENARLRDYVAYLTEASAKTAVYLHCHNWKWEPEFLARGDKLRAALNASPPAEAPGDKEPTP